MFLYCNANEVFMGQWRFQIRFSLWKIVFFVRILFRKAYSVCSCHQVWEIKLRRLYKLKKAEAKIMRSYVVVGFYQ